jgi:predicted GH43/DUF377 family glycosyl hydrolase
MITHLETRLAPDPSLVVIRPFQIAPEPRDLHAPQLERARRIVKTVAALEPESCHRALERVNADFVHRHRETRDIYLQRAVTICKTINVDCLFLTDLQQQLIGAYFCLEYAYCAAAVTNPSVVLHPDQTDLGQGDIRFILSLRNVGEGHISSISFREGLLTDDNALHLWPAAGPTLAATTSEVLNEDCVFVQRPASVAISSTVIFPFTRPQRNGLEDLRMVRFIDDDGTATWHGTYTAYSGSAVRSEILTTSDFTSFTLQALTGAGAEGKGMALFPRRLDGAYAMLGRHDGENHYLMKSDTLLDWPVGEKIAAPVFLWELVQSGNCGSPIELDEGFLVITHGVGAMRKYAIGAMLLDKGDPRKVLARSVEPFLVPTDPERNGYVPNVVYSCGALRKGDTLFLPYGVADTSVAFALVDIPQLLASLH